MTKIVNLFAGPGAGKSTTAAGLFYVMKSAGISCEMAREYAKDVVWRGHSISPKDQLYILAKQERRQQDLVGKVDYVICDSPLLNALVYGKDLAPSFEHVVVDMFNSFDNINVFVSRNKPYHPEGRFQSEEQALMLDDDFLGVLEERGLSYARWTHDGFESIQRLLYLITYDGGWAIDFR